MDTGQEIEEEWDPFEKEAEDLTLEEAGDLILEQSDNIDYFIIKREIKETYTKRNKITEAI